jgi:hypothetical protein
MAASSPLPTAAATRFGMAGLIPPHFPSPSAADYEAMYRSFASTGGAVGVYTNWADPGKEGAVPGVIASVSAAAARYSFGPLVIAIGVAQDAPGGGVKSTVDWSSPQRQRFIDVVTTIARERRPELLALGVETNRLHGSDLAAFEGFVSGYADAYDAIKRVSPQTKVFTIFQLELMRGTAYLMTAKQQTPAQWDLLAKFKLDVAAYTTYPYLHFTDPKDIPDDYYVDAKQRTPSAPIAFTEIGWPSADLGGPATGSPYGGTPEEQAAFVTRFLALTRPLTPSVALWTFPNDLGASAPGTYASISLRRNDGTPKPALEAWHRGIAER